MLTDPTTFDQDDQDGTVVLLHDEAAADIARQAVHLCPSRALSLAP